MHRLIGAAAVAGAVLVFVPTSASADPVPLPSITLPLPGLSPSPSASASSAAASPAGSLARTAATARPRPAPAKTPTPAAGDRADVPSPAAMVESLPPTQPSARPGSRSASAPAQGQQADAAPSDSGHWVRWGIVMAVLLTLLGIALGNLFGRSPRKYAAPAGTTPEGYALGYVNGYADARTRAAEAGDDPDSGPHLHALG